MRTISELRTHKILCFGFGSDDDDNDDRFIHFFRSFCPDLLVRMWAAAAKMVFFLLCVLKSIEWFDIPSHDSIIYMGTKRLLSCNVCSLCVFDILIKILFSQWSAAKKNLHFRESKLPSHLEVNTFSYIEYEVIT